MWVEVGGRERILREGGRRVEVVGGTADVMEGREEEVVESGLREGGDFLEGDGRSENLWHKSSSSICTLEE
jgi:hypothetical protein